MLSAVEEVRHMSNSWVVTLLLFILKIRTVREFIFCKPESLDPSIARETTEKFGEKAEYSNFKRTDKGLQKWVNMQFRLFRSRNYSSKNNIFL